jgi:hypothetical protein
MLLLFTTIFLILFYHKKIIYHNKDMSIPVAIGSFTSKADFQRKKQDQKKLLKLQTQLNTAADKASTRISELMEGVKPAALPEVQVSEVLQDINAQREIAVQNSDEILSKRESRAFVNNYLTSLDELVLFNRNFEDFRSEVSGTSQLDAPYLNILWERFKRQLYAGTSDYASLTRLQDEVDQMARDILAMAEGLLPDADYLNLEQAVQDAARRFDLKELKRLRKRAMGIEEQGQQKQRAEKAIKRIRTSRQAEARRQMEAEDVNVPEPSPSRTSDVMNRVAMASSYDDFSSDFRQSSLGNPYNALRREWKLLPADVKQQFSPAPKTADAYFAVFKNLASRKR